MKRIDPKSFVQFMGTPLSADLGVEPELAWLNISDLRIDPSYQRDINRGGSRNVGKIARRFDWSLFGVVIVARLGDGLYAIVDGQHRTISAALRKATRVPCSIITATAGKQAEAFAAINGAVTAISPLAIHHAEVVAGAPEAVSLRNTCASVNVQICRYPVPASDMKPGQTLAIRALQEGVRQHGHAHLRIALGSIMASRTNKGVLKAPVIKAVCHVLESAPEWKKTPEKLNEAMSGCDLLAELSAAELEGKRDRKSSHAVLGLRLMDYLDARMTAIAA